MFQRQHRPRNPFANEDRDRRICGARVGRSIVQLRQDRFAPSTESTEVRQSLTGASVPPATVKTKSSGFPNDSMFTTIDHRWICTRGIDAALSEQSNRTDDFPRFVVHRILHRKSLTATNHPRRWNGCDHPVRANELPLPKINSRTRVHHVVLWFCLAPSL